MFPPIFEVCKAVSAITTLIGTNPVRLYPFGEAPEGVALPYVVWQTTSGLPENLLDGAPDIDQWSLQIDVYAATPTDARNVAKALRNAIELHAYVTAWRGERRDSGTKDYNYSFDVDWLVNR